jgi:hypothetical protein
MRRNAWTLVLLLSSCASLAPEPKPVVPQKFTSVWSKVCREDSEKLCANWKAKDGTRADCLARAEKELSGRCYQALRESAPPCLFDRARWCPQFKPTDARVWTCLSEKGKEVSLSCRTYRTDLASRANSLRKACGSDSERLCSSAGPAPWRCLREHLDQVSPGCRGEFLSSVKGKRRAG